MKPILSFLLVLVLTGASCSAKTADNATSSYDSLVNAYIAIKDALAADNSTLAAAEAANFEKLASSAVLTGKAKTAFDKEQKKLLARAHAIRSSKDIETMREEFRGLSDAMIRILQAAPLSSRTVYVQYCPMKKASWLSFESAIRNPYYGNQMLRCGSVQQTIRSL